MNKKELNLFGLNQEEFDSLSLEDLILYDRLHHNVGILFEGFSIEDMAILEAKAENAKFRVYQKLYFYVKFLCISEKVNIKLARYEKAKKNGFIIISKDEFENHCLKIDEENLLNNSFLFNQAVPVEYRIPNPLSDFDEAVYKPISYIVSDNGYITDLYKMTCGCKDYIKNNRKNFKIGDVRRMCGCLMYKYKQNFGLHGVSELNSLIIEHLYTWPLEKFKGEFTELNKVIIESWDPKKQYQKFIKVDKSEFPVILNFDHNDDWWNVYVKKKEGYVRYGYSIVETRWSYGESPYGIVPQLREQFELIDKEIGNNKSPKNRMVIKKQDLYLKKREAFDKKTIQTEYDQRFSCITFIVFIILFLFLLRYLNSCFSLTG